MKLAAILASAAAVALAAPNSLPERNIKDRQLDLMYPHRTFRYWINTQELKEDPQDQLLVVKNGNPDDESSCIVTFDFPPEVEGKTCRLVFDLWKDRDHSTGTQTADVFTVIDPPLDDSVSVQTLKQNVAEWRPAHSRDQHQGRVKLPVPGPAEWIESYHGYPEFPCPAGQLLGLEYVGAGDRVEVRWDIGVTGPRVQVL
ncbi:hypothetical protein AJ80_00134 [Polytolypa hystricis UAMH7299]|uniref:Ubiquitin 3 binding protein But2 C-terminal domain-containing protein n=1 Tax=Polytolypa hystricis (strain UAMH7299) TaxID=1447883 RepID=A0A2B7Z4T0_POLH7|nr:hypothetical protein AJ80_00134 [Polytolypa hystricis UAMH7299]